MGTGKLRLGGRRAGSASWGAVPTKRGQDKPCPVSLLQLPHFTRRWEP